MRWYVDSRLHKDTTREMGLWHAGCWGMHSLVGEGEHTRLI